jgi:hypothetical protein
MVGCAVGVCGVVGCRWRCGARTRGRWSIGGPIEGAFGIWLYVLGVLSGNLAGVKKAKHYGGLRLAEVG